MRDRSRNARAGFTLVELMVVVAVIAILSSLAIPRFLSARIPSQETKAISALRSLCSAQAQIKSANAIDTDADGAGEYGCFAELAGVAPLRVADGTGAPTSGAAGVDELSPTALSQVFGNLDANGAVVIGGYVFKIYLPEGGAAPGGIPEEGPGGFTGAPYPDPDNGETLWCAYAWPFEEGVSGNRAFFVNQEGEILHTANRGSGGAPVYTGVAVANHPAFSAAYLNPQMTADLALSATGTDGNLWAPVN